MTKIIIGLILGLFFNLANANSVNSATTKASATLASVCTISSQNINFGQIALPISNQSATSSINVQCTKGSSYTIGLAYGGIYGQGGVSNGNYYQVLGIGGGCPADASTYWNEYNSSGVVISHTCTTSWSVPPSGTTYSNGNYYVSSPSYAYGILNGASKGDGIAYFIQVPGNPNQVWNSGNYSYTSTGTGSNQSIAVIATLKPSNTPNSYPSADSYLDTVVATINY